MVQGGIVGAVVAAVGFFAAVATAGAGSSPLDDGKAFEAKRNYQQAAEAYRRAIAESPKAPEPRYRLAAAYRALGRSDEAIEALQHALELKPAYRKPTSCWARSTRSRSGGPTPSRRIPGRLT
jgi:tetratricopeptide (TPR) repeat protein